MGGGRDGERHTVQRFEVIEACSRGHLSVLVLVATARCPDVQKGSTFANSRCAWLISDLDTCLEEGARGLHEWRTDFEGCFATNAISLIQALLRVIMWRVRSGYLKKALPPRLSDEIAHASEAPGFSSTGASNARYLRLSIFNMSYENKSVWLAFHCGGFCRALRRHYRSSLIQAVHL